MIHLFRLADQKVRMKIIATRTRTAVAALVPILT